MFISDLFTHYITISQSVHPFMLNDIKLCKFENIENVKIMLI